MIIGKTRGLLQFEIWWNAGPTFFVNKIITYFNCIDSLVALFYFILIHDVSFDSLLPYENKQLGLLCIRTKFNTLFENLK